MPQVRPSPRPARKASIPLPLPTTLLSPPRPPSASGALGAQAGGQVQGGGLFLHQYFRVLPASRSRSLPVPPPLPQASGRHPQRKERRTDRGGSARPWV